jgi:hypothetical protein
MSKVEEVTTIQVTPGEMTEADFNALVDAMARNDMLAAMEIDGVVGVGSVEFTEVDDDDGPGMFDAEGAFGDDGVPEMTDEEAAFHSEVEASDPNPEHEDFPGQRVPEDAWGQRFPERFEPPVDDDGFQCGMCLLNRRQCLACARREATEINDGLDAVADDDGRWVRYAGNVTTVEDEHDRAMAHEYLKSLPDWERLIRREYRQCKGPQADAAVEVARRAGRS